MDDQGDYFQFFIQLGSTASESFQILFNGAREEAVYPRTPNANTHERHSIGGPDPKGHGLNWTVGMHADDAAEMGARYEIRLNVTDSGLPWTVTWRKLGDKEQMKRGFFV